MADLTDVANALVGVIANIVYPNGTANPSITNADVLVYQGWPNSAELTSALAAGKVHISVFGKSNDRVTSTAMGDAEWQEDGINVTDGTGISSREIRRQTRAYQVTVWANCFEHRDPIAAQIDTALADVTRLTFSDGSKGVMSYVSSFNDDSEQKQGIYRRDFIYDVNYATIEKVTDYIVKEFDINVTVGYQDDDQKAVIAAQLT